MRQLCIRDNCLVYKIIIPFFIAIRLEKRALVLSRHNKKFSIAANKNFLFSLKKKERALYIKMSSYYLKFKERFLRVSLCRFKGLARKIDECVCCLLKESKALVFLIGLGFKLELSKYSRVIFLKLGFSHYIKVLTPVGIQVFSPKESVLLLKSSSQELLYTFVHLLQKCKRPDVYKNKGVFLNWQSLRVKKIKKIG